MLLSSTGRRVERSDGYRRLLTAGETRTWTRRTRRPGDSCRTLVGPLAERGVVGVATTFVDNSGVARVKAVPAGAAAPSGRVGGRLLDRLRPVPVRRLDRRAGDRRRARSATCGSSRTYAGWCRSAARPAGPGRPPTATPRTARRTTSAVGCCCAAGRRSGRAGHHGEGGRRARVGESRAATTTLPCRAAGPAYGMDRLVDASDYCRDVLVALADSGRGRRAVPPRVRAGQLEISVAPEDPVSAADTSVLVRATIRAVGRRYGLRTSFSPKVAARRRRQRRARAPLALARRAEPDGRRATGRFGLTARRRGLRRRRARAPPGADGGRARPA